MVKLAFYFILAVLSYQTYAQDTTYFPSKLGNTWVYRYNDGRIEKETITRDSTDQLGNRFVGINADNLWFNKWRFMISSNQDSVFGVSVTRKLLRYRFPITGTGDRWMVRPKGDSSLSTPGIAIVNNTYDANIFGKATTAYYISYFRFYLQNGDTVLDSRGWEKDQIIAKGFGVIYEESEGEYKEIVGCVINGDTLGYVPTSVDDDKEKNIPETFTLEQNYPNPFNPGTVISFYLPHSGEVELKVYDMFGREVKTLLSDYVSEGRHSVEFNAGNISSGLYFYRLRAGKSIVTKKMLYLK